MQRATRALLGLAAACSALTPTVLVTDGLAPCGLERLAERGAKIEELNDRSLQEALSSADGVIVERDDPNSGSDRASTVIKMHREGGRRLR